MGMSFILNCTTIMLTYDETKIVFFVGGCSSKTTSFQYGGLNPNWAPSKLLASASTCSEPSAKLARILGRTIKPPSATAPIRPHDLDDEMLVDDNPAPLQKTKKSSQLKTVHIHPLSSTKVIPPTLDDNDTLNSFNSDVEIKEQASNPIPVVSVQERGYDEFDEYSPEEREYALSSLLKKEVEEPEVSTSILNKFIHYSLFYDTRTY